MASTDATNFRLSVLNPGGRDLEQYFDEPLRPGEIGHPPVNLHAFSASTEGSFHRATKNAIEEKRSILLVLRGNFKAGERALAECQKEQRLVAITLKETGLHQIAQQLHDPKQLARFMRIVGIPRTGSSTPTGPRAGFGRLYSDAVSAGRRTMEIHRSTWGTAWDFHWHPRMGRAVAKSFRRALASPGNLRGQRRTGHGF